MRDYEEQAPIAFIHVPKSGGTSLRSVFAAWFGEKLHKHYRDARTGQVPPIAQLTPGDCLFGHFPKSKGLGIRERYPSVDQFVTVLRDPFDAMVSRYFYVREKGGDWLQRPPPLDLSLPEFLTEYPPTMLDHLPLELTFGNYRQLMRRHFVHIGVTERLCASLACLAKKLGRRVPAAIPMLNVTDRPRDLDPRLRAAFRQRHPLAYAIYEFALDNHDRMDS